MENLTFGQRIVHFRTQKKMLQKELAEEVGISATALNYYEKDKREPNVFIITELARVLGVTGDDLLGIVQKKTFDEKIIPPSEKENQLMVNFRQLNSVGQEKLLGYADDLVSSGKYK